MVLTGTWTKTKEITTVTNLTQEGQVRDSDD